MRFSFLILTVMFFGMNLYSQIDTYFEDFPKEILEQIDKMGTDTSSTLTTIEGMYFNVLFQQSRNNFDFCGKKWHSFIVLGK
jgi:hypothetical protein